jgi:hypothetical protein
VAPRVAGLGDNVGWGAHTADRGAGERDPHPQTIRRDLALVAPNLVVGSLWLSVRSGIIYGLWLSRQVRPLTLSNPTGPTRARAAVDSNGMTDCSGERRETKCIQC